MTGADGQEPLDPRAAMELVGRTRSETRRALDVRTDLLFAAWGLVWLVGLGGMYLSVRDQSPYRGPATWSAVLLGALDAIAVATTVVVTRRATRGIGGDAAVQGLMFGLSWLVGFAALFAIQSGLARQGASAEVLGLVGAGGPMLVVGLVYLGGAAIWRDWTMFVLGAWLALLAAVGVMTGPVTLLLIDAVGGGVGFLLAAAWVRSRRRA